MARVEILATVDKLISDADLLSPYMSPVVGASVQVNVRSTGTPAVVYAAETGGTTVSNPLVTDANGRVNGWVDEGSYVLAVSGSGITSYNQPYDAVRGDGVTNIATGAVGLSQLVAAVTDALFKPGDIKLSAKGSADTGFLLCQGQTVSRTTYAALFAAIGTAYNIGGEAGTDFRLPDLRSRVPIGPDASAGLIGTNNTLGAKGGEATHILTSGEMPSHTHTGGAHTHTGGAHTHADTFAVASGGAHTHSFFGDVPTTGGIVSYVGATSPGNQLAFAATSSNTWGGLSGTLSAGTHTHTVTGGVSSGGAVATTSDGAVATTATGGGTAHNNVQPYTVVNYQIKT